jgi:hypothetical protein
MPVFRVGSSLGFILDNIYFANPPRLTGVDDGKKRIKTIGVRSGPTIEIKRPPGL